MLYFSTISRQTLELLMEIQDIPVLENFSLVGESALALRYGHKISVDLDFFTGNEFEISLLVDTIKDKHTIRILSQAKNSLTLKVENTKIDFIRHNYPLINPVQTNEGIKMISVENIAAMKLNSTMNGGSKKDFYDIYELLNDFAMAELISFHAMKYNFSSQMILLKSLNYFEDAESEPDPVSVKSVSWNLVKLKITEDVDKLVHKKN